MVIDGTQVKVLAWYDNEWGYANRMIELAAKVGAALADRHDSAAAATRRGADLRNYALVTGAYWADTIADGAIRMLVLFYFYERGYSPFEVALAVPVLRALRRHHQPRRRLPRRAAGPAGHARRRARHADRSRSAMLAVVPGAWLVVPYVMVAQALSGIAKDLTKMSSKSAVKLVVPDGRDRQLYRWVAILTGSKNALKGVGLLPRRAAAHPDRASAPALLVLDGAWCWRRCSRCSC